MSICLYNFYKNFRQMVYNFIYAALDLWALAVESRTLAVKLRARQPDIRAKTPNLPAELPPASRLPKSDSVCNPAFRVRAGSKGETMPQIPVKMKLRWYTRRFHFVYPAFHCPRIGDAVPLSHKGKSWRVYVNAFYFAGKFLFKGFESEKVVAEDEAVVEYVFLAGAVLGVVAFSGGFQQDAGFEAGAVFLADPG
jgi:hypothetical protein